MPPINASLIAVLDVIAGAVAAGVAIYLVSRGQQKSRIVKYDYSEKPSDQIIYYEILSDIIAEMRHHIGNDAIHIAQDIPDLSVDSKTGKVLDIKKDPSRIIAILVFRYEALLGKKLNFGLRK